MLTKCPFLNISIILSEVELIKFPRSNSFGAEIILYYNISSFNKSDNIYISNVLVFFINLRMQKYGLLYCLFLSQELDRHNNLHKIWQFWGKGAALNLPKHWRLTYTAFDILSYAFTF